MIAPARVAAYDVLSAVSAGLADLPDALAATRATLRDPRDQALAADIAIGVQRWRAAIDHLIVSFSKRPLQRLDREVVEVLRLSVYQLLHLTRVPAAAVVDDAVNLTGRVGKRSAAGLVNAVLRAAALGLIGCLALVWAILVLPRSEAADDLRDIESRLLRSEAFNRASLTQTLESQISRDLSPCDTHSQKALLLMEMPLAEAALRSGAAAEFDRHIQSLETRSRKVLGCTPRESFVWLLAFDLEVLHGRLNEQSFDLLAMSYETSPNEAWISIRRIVAAMPLVLAAPEPVRQKILFEFQQLIRNGFVDDAARCYFTASSSVRSLLQAQIERLDLPRQKDFSDALQKIHS